MSPLKETCNEEDVCAETVSEHPDPLQCPLPPSPLLSLAPIMDPVDPLQPLVNPQESDAPPREDKNGPSDDSGVSTPSPSVEPPVTIDIVLTAPPPDQTSQASPEPSPSPQLEPTPDLPGPDSDEDEVGIHDVHIPALIAPAIFFPIPNLRLSYIFKPVLTWWLSKDVLSYPYLYS